MDIRHLTPAYAVSPQIEPGDVAAIREAGFTAIICTRPDEEVGADQAAEAMRAAAEAEGLVFHDNPVRNGALSAENVEAQHAVLENATGSVFAYCRSGTRSAIVWALGEAGRQPVGTIIETAARAGYDLSGLRPQLDRIASSGSPDR